MAAIAVASTNQSTDTAPAADINSPRDAAGLRDSAQAAQAASPLEVEVNQDPKQDPKPSVEQQLANMQKQIDEMKAMIKSIAENTSMPAEARLAAIQAALNPPAAQVTPPPAAAAANPSVVGAPPPVQNQEDKKGAESKPAPAANGGLSALGNVTPKEEAPKAGASASNGGPTTAGNVAAKEEAPKAASPAANGGLSALGNVTPKEEAPKAAPPVANGGLSALGNVAAKEEAPKQEAPKAAAPKEDGAKQTLIPPSLNPLSALEKVVPIQTTIDKAKEAAENLAGQKPAPEAKVEAPQPVVKPEVKVEAPREEKPAPVAPPKVGAALSPELLARAQAIGGTLADDYSRTSYDFRAIAQKAELAAVKEKIADPETRKLFNEQIARTFAERTIRAQEGNLSEFSDRSSGTDIERTMRYDVMGRILGGGNPQKGNGQAGEMLKEVAGERISELLAQKSTYEDGQARVKTIEGLARRFSVDKPAEGIKTERQEIRESALEEFKAVLGAPGIDAEQRERILSGIVDKANSGPDVLSEEDLAPIFKEHIDEELKGSRGEGVQKRRARLNELTELADTFDVEDEPEVKSALDAMKLEISAELLDKGVDEILNDKKRSWSQTADELRELRSDALDMSGVSKEEANRVIEEKLKAWVASRDVQSLAHAKEMNDGIDRIDGALGFSKQAIAEMKGAVRADVMTQLDDMLDDERKKVDEILLSNKNGVSLDGKEREARSYIAEVAKVGDKELAREIKIRLGSHAVETILDGEIKNKVDFDTRADEAEDLARSLEIKDEAAQVVAKVAEKRFSEQPESEQEVATMKKELSQLMIRSDLRPEDTRDSKSVLRKDATQRLVELDKQLDEKLVAIQEDAREKARLAAQARVEKAKNDIVAILGNDEMSMDKRIAEVNKIQKTAGIPVDEVKKIVEAKIDELARRNDRRSTASAARLAQGFGVDMQ